MIVVSRCVGELRKIRMVTIRPAETTPRTAWGTGGRQSFVIESIVGDLRKRAPGEVNWIVSGYLARGELMFLAGAGESLKSGKVHVTALRSIDSPHSDSLTLEGGARC